MVTLPLGAGRYGSLILKGITIKDLRKELKVHYIMYDIYHTTTSLSAINFFKDLRKE